MQLFWDERQIQIRCFAENYPLVGRAEFLKYWLSLYSSSVRGKPCKPKWVNSLPMSWFWKKEYWQCHWFLYPCVWAALFTSNSSTRGWASSLLAWGKYARNAAICPARHAVSPFPCHVAVYVTKHLSTKKNRQTRKRDRERETVKKKELKKGIFKFISRHLLHSLLFQTRPRVSVL